MDTKILTEQEFLVVGMSFYGDPFTQASGWDEDNEIGLLWKRFMAFYYENNEAIKHKVAPDVCLEIHIETKETTEKGNVEVFVGVIVDKLEATPVECVVKVLPVTQYAVFTLQGQQITSDWSKMVYGWLPSAGYCISYKYTIQYYDSRFKGLDKIEESSLDIYLPVKRVA